jgi:hypothetical protein
MVNPRLTQEQQQDFMEWLFASLMGAGYFGKAHLICDDGQDREPEIFTALMRNEPIFLYRQGARPSPTVEGYGLVAHWRRSEFEGVPVGDGSWRRVKAKAYISAAPTSVTIAGKPKM